MSAMDWLLLGIVAVCAFFAWRTWRRSLKSGGCCSAGCTGNCARCGGNCTHRKKEK